MEFVFWLISFNIFVFPAFHAGVRITIYTSGDWSQSSQHFSGSAVSTAPPPQSHLGEQVNDITHCLIFVLNEIRLCAQF
jgi:hypothetical protein